MSIDALGWNARWEAMFAVHRSRGCEPGRISGQDRERYDVLDAGGESAAEVSGRFRHEARDPEELPAVGDWVALRTREHDGPRVIVAVLPRATAFVRKEAGKVTRAQVVAANLDAVFVVSGLDGDFNLRRIERYLATAWDGGATPVVVLNKADLAEDLDARLAEVEARAPGVPVVAVSAMEGRGLETLEPWLGVGHTVALLGSSGVGRSTLVNAQAPARAGLAGGQAEPAHTRGAGDPLALDPYGAAASHQAKIRSTDGRGTVPEMVEPGAHAIARGCR